MELKKLLAVREQSQIIGEFLEWLDEQEIRLGEVGQSGFGDWRMFEISESKERLLARYFDIDLDKVEEEQREILYPRYNSD